MRNLHDCVIIFFVNDVRGLETNRAAIAGHCDIVVCGVDTPVSIGGSLR